MSKFIALFNDSIFRELHQLAGEDEAQNFAWRKFSTSVLSARDKNSIANSLQHTLYCAPCLEAERDGSLDSRLVKLRCLRLCGGCNERHAAALFPDSLAGEGNKNETRDPTHGSKAEDGQIENSTVRSPGSASGLCIGLVGHISLCNHAGPVTTWQDIQQRLQEPSRHERKYHSACVELSHEPEWERNIGRIQAPISFPRLIAKEDASIPSMFEISYAWDMRLLDTSASLSPSLDAVRETLSKLVRQVFSASAPGESIFNTEAGKLCAHTTVKDIQSFAYTGVCRCISGYQPGLGASGELKACGCKRQVALECRICGVMYSWHSDHFQHITLSCRYMWRLQTPTSPAWLGLLDDSWREKLRTAENRNVLWCETPGCRTNTRPRWEALVKENLEQEYKAIRHGNGHDGQNCSLDYRESCLAARGCSYQNW